MGAYRIDTRYPCHKHAIYIYPPCIMEPNEILILESFIQKKKKKNLVIKLLVASWPSIMEGPSLELWIQKSVFFFFFSFLCQSSFIASTRTTVIGCQWLTFFIFFFFFQFTHSGMSIFFVKAVSVISTLMAIWCRS